MPEVATAILVGGAVAGAVGSSKQAGANREGASTIAQLASTFGKEQMDKLDTLDYDPVELLNLVGDAEELIDFGYDTSREKAYGENVDDVDALQRESLERANFDFSSLPPDILRAMDNSALARTAGGPAGLAENISLQNRMALSDQGFDIFNAISSNNAQFTPNPVGTLFELGKFNTAQQQNDLQFEMQKIGQELQVEEFKFRAQTGAIQQKAANNASAVGFTGLSSALSAVGQGFSSAGLTSATNAAASSMQNTAASTTGQLSTITGR